VHGGRDIGVHLHLTHDLERLPRAPRAAARAHGGIEAEGVGREAIGAHLGQQAHHGLHVPVLGAGVHGVGVDEHVRLYAGRAHLPQYLERPVAPAEQVARAQGVLESVLVDDRVVEPLPHPPRLVVHREDVTRLAREAAAW